MPLLITMRTPELWVPLEILANEGAPVNADLFLLTDKPLRRERLPPRIDIDSATGFTVAGAEPMNASLHHDLSIDRNMSWVPAPDT